MDDPSPLPLSPDQRAELESYAAASSSGWYLTSQDSLPKAFAQSLRDKVDSALLIVSGTSSATTYLVFDALRVDKKAGLIDQEPFAVAVTGSGASSGGVFVHHGSWVSRSFAPPDGFWQIVQSSGVGNYFLANPGKTSGSLEDLPFGCAGAWDAVMAHVTGSNSK